MVTIQRGRYRGIPYRCLRRSEYESLLADIGVLVRARNSLVFQGDVESIAQKSSSELTNLFEEISGSARLQQTYTEVRR